MMAAVILEELQKSEEFTSVGTPITKETISHIELLLTIITLSHIELH